MDFYSISKDFVPAGDLSVYNHILSPSVSCHVSRYCAYCYRQAKPDKFIFICMSFCLSQFFLTKNYQQTQELLLIPSLWDHWNPMMCVDKMNCTSGQGNSKQFRFTKVRPPVGPALFHQLGSANDLFIKGDLPKEQDNPVSLLGSPTDTTFDSMPHSQVDTACVPLLIPAGIILNPAPLQCVCLCSSPACS